MYGMCHNNSDREVIMLPSLFTSILVPEAGVAARVEGFAARSRGSSSFEKKNGNGSGSRVLLCSNRKLRVLLLRTLSMCDIYSYDQWESSPLGNKYSLKVLHYCSHCFHLQICVTWI